MDAFEEQRTPTSRSIAVLFRARWTKIARDTICRVGHAHRRTHTARHGGHSPPYPGLRSETTVLRALLALCLLVGLSGCGLSKLHRDPQLFSQLDAVLQRHADTGAQLSARVVDLESGTELYAVNPTVPVMPASNMKLVTSSAGLDLLGPHHTFNTYLARDGDDLWLIGTGDPGIGDSALAKRRNETTMTVLDGWVKALRQKNLTRITGDLVYYEGVFDTTRFHESWEQNDRVHWYAAPVSGLNFNGNCVDITVSPTAPGTLAAFDVTPPFDDLVVINKCVTGSNKPPSIDRMAHANVIVLGGGCDKKKTLKSKPVIDPGLFFAGALRRHLATNGIVIEGKIRSSATALGGTLPPPTDTIIATHTTTMPEVLWRINKSSQNLFAECLSKTTGRAFNTAQGKNHPGSWANGERAIRTFLRKNRINDKNLTVADGSGLSRNNRVTTRLICDVLQTMHSHPNAEVFRASLAEPGQNGTLNRRMKDLSGHVFAKTGYVRGVRALSGYIKTKTGRWLCFSIIYNNIPGSVQPYNKLQDKACQLLVDWNPDRPAADKK